MTGRNCAVCYDWTTSAALSQQETDNEFCSLLHAGTQRPVCVWKGCLCVQVCILSVGDKLSRVCAVLGLLFFSLSLIMCMNLSGSGCTCVFVCRLLCVCVYVCPCVSEWVGGVGLED